MTKEQLTAAIFDDPDGIGPLLRRHAGHPALEEATWDAICKLEQEKPEEFGRLMRRVLQAVADRN